MTKLYSVLVIMGNIKGNHYFRTNDPQAAFRSCLNQFRTPRYPGDEEGIVNPTCLFGEAKLVEENT